jgi:metal-responsive CopG/Arc/MetJ family transcriptional regulator
MSDETNDNSSPRAVFKCSQALLDAIDLTAAASFTTRSNIIRDAVVDRLRREGVIPAPGASHAGG